MSEFMSPLFKPKADFAKLIQAEALIIDVRTKQEYGAGHMEVAKNIPLGQR